MTMGDGSRRESPVTRLARLGFTDPPAALDTLSHPALAVIGTETLLSSLGDAADPDLAARSLARIAGATGGTDAITATAVDAAAWRRLMAVLGSSAALGDHLARHPEHVGAFAVSIGNDQHTDVATSAKAALLRALDADPAADTPVSAFTGPAALDTLRVSYRRQLLAIAGQDLAGEIDVETVGHQLADLAQAALEAALAIARAEIGPSALDCRLAVVGMGKTGARELNYVSDVDVVFVAEPDDALPTAHRLAAALMRACSAATAEGVLWPVDAALRPEGNAGALVRTLASHRTYYERWAKTWEFQALLKARQVAGDAALGQQYVATIAPLVWSAADRPAFVEDVQAMRRRVEESIPADRADRQLKLGRGGLRDVEFAVQLLQLVHGRSDETLRTANTLEALRALAAGGYVARADAAVLEETYRFLRVLEHRLQVFRLRRTHMLPDAEPDLRRLGRALGYRLDPVGELTESWREHQRTARRLHEKLFYRPLLLAVSRLPAEEARLTKEAARQRLEALGYTDPEGALRHLEALTHGVSRRAAIQRTLLPVMLGWFADAASPDAGLLAFRQVSEALGTTPWYLRLLRDQGATAERLARILASSKFATDLLLRAPEAVAMLGDDAELRPARPEQLHAQVQATVSRVERVEEAIAATRAIRRRELLRISVADILGLLTVDAVGEALTAVTAAVLGGGVELAVQSVKERSGPLPTRIAVIAMGRLGGHEQGYGSDADVLFVHDPLSGADERSATDAAHAVANELRRLLALPVPDPALLVDADLRPEGKQGPLVRTVASYAAYYERWAQVWERQALLRAEPIAGDPKVGARFVEIIDPIRWSATGLSQADRREIRRIKARVESERLPRGADPTLHTKLGRGGLADVEWTVQTLQLAFAARVAGLRTTKTLDALRAAVDADLLAAADANTLTEAWQFASRLRNAIVLVRGRAADSVPSDARERAAVARLLGYPAGNVGELVEDYRRVTRRARTTVERVFYS